MATFIITRDKNYMVIRDMSKTAPYKFDVNTGIFYGLRGKPSKSTPSGFPTWLSNNYRGNNVLALMYGIRVYHNRYGSYNVPTLGDMERYAKYFKLVDRLASIGYINTRWDGFNNPSELDYIEENFKQFAKYVKNCKDNDETPSVSDFKSTWFKRSWITSHNLVADDEHFTDEVIDRLYTYRDNYTEDLLPHLVTYIKRGTLDFWDYNAPKKDTYDKNIAMRNFISKACQYERMCAFLEKDMEKGDFFRNYINTAREYALMKDEIDDKAIQFQLRKYPALAFSNEKYTVVIPQTVADFQHEAEHMRNCVYSMYMRRVMEGTTNVVFVRKNSDLDKPYITCEVSNSGSIIQYLAYANSRPTTKSALDFKEAYRTHLKENWQ